MINVQCAYLVVNSETTPACLVLKDVGHHRGLRSLTNDIEAVVAELFANGQLPQGRALFYYDSCGELTMVIHHLGEFLGWMPAGGELP